MKKLSIIVLAIIIVAAIILGVIYVTNINKKLQEENIPSKTKIEVKEDKIIFNDNGGLNL